MDVDLDHAGIGRDADDVQARIVRRRIALDMHRQAERGGGGLGRGDQLEIVLERSTGGMNTQSRPSRGSTLMRGAHRAVELAERLLDAGPAVRLGGGEARRGLRPRGRLARALEVGQRTARSSVGSAGWM